MTGREAYVRGAVALGMTEAEAERRWTWICAMAERVHAGDLEIGAAFAALGDKPRLTDTASA